MEKEAKEEEGKIGKKHFTQAIDPSGPAQNSRLMKAKAAKYSVYGFDYRIKRDSNIN